MSGTRKNTKTRRDFLKVSGNVVAASTVLSVGALRVHAAEDNVIRLALMGCGGRGTGAAANAMATRTHATRGHGRHFRRPHATQLRSPRWATARKVPASADPCRVVIDGHLSNTSFEVGKAVTATTDKDIATGFGGCY